MSEGKVLPNLKITIKDDATKSQDCFEEGELSDQDEIDIIYEEPEREISSTWKNDNVRNNPSRTYSNKTEGFKTGLNFSSSDFDTKLKVRAERFGIAMQEHRNVSQSEINDLYKSLGLDLKSFQSSSKHIRLNTVHIRGVNEMNHNDVINYFRIYGQSDIEWINDASCNICFPDEGSAARALLGLSKPFTIKTKGKLFEDSDPEAGIDCDLRDEVQKEELNTKLNTPPIGIIDVMNNKGATNFLNTDKMEIDESPVIYDSKKSGNVDIPVPPGHWRVGVSHPKAKSLFLRFATKDDKKLPGAEKNSNFYKKNGNPNYGGMKGLISGSKKRKFKTSNTRRMVEELRGNKRSLNDHIISSGSRRYSKFDVKDATMYADHEEKMYKQRRFSHETSKRVNYQKGSVKSRIGRRYEKTDLVHLGKQFSSDEEPEITNTLDVKCLIPATFSKLNNVWEEQAKAMAEEDKIYSQNKSNYDSSASSDSEETERYDAFRSERAQYDANMKNFNSKPMNYRDTYKSTFGKEDTKVDLRLKINSLRKDLKSNKHRSPLCRDDFE